MADVRPLRALHYDPAREDIGAVVSPPYDVIDPTQRAALQAQSPHNVVEIDLPQGDDPYATAAAAFARWRDEGVLVRDAEPAFWAQTQDYTGPDGRPYTRSGLFARVRVEEYGPGRIRPHERTHPGPKEDRLRLTRATRTNLSPIFALYDDPDNAAWRALEPAASGTPFADVTDVGGTRHRLWRVTDPAALEAVTAALEPSELLIADGHHRYETARVYAEEIGGEGAHRYVMACLVALQDPGLTVFPTHRLLTGLDTVRQEALRDAMLRDWDVEKVDLDALEPAPAEDSVQLGYLDAFHRQPYRLTLKDAAVVDAALPYRSAAYRGLDTAVLEALVLKGALGMSEDDISHLHGLDYSRTTDEARERILSGDVQAGFFTGATPVARIRDVAAAGEVMPPKSTFFFPKVLTGLLLNPLDEE
ncbi:MAG: DUF1015 domain-containing protein [Solirubrobacteraceae bacterium]